MAKQSTGKKPTVIALTGGTGFLGGHMLTKLLSAGFSVRALTRRPQADRDGVEWISGSLSDEASLYKLCLGTDRLINLAGLTKALNRNVFFDVNVGGSKLLFEAAAKAGVSHVMHISSLAAREPRLSHYGASKAGTEMLLTARKWPFSWTIVRPPAIYGPGDKEIFKLLKAAKYGFLPWAGSAKNRFSMIHGEDLAAAITQLSFETNHTAIFEIDDGKTGGYQLSDVAEALADEKGKKPKAFAVPFWILGTVGAVNGMIASAVNRPTMLTLSAASYMCHPDWTVRERRRPKIANWTPQFDLKSGLKHTLDWYKKNGLL